MYTRNVYRQTFSVNSRLFTDHLGRANLTAVSLDINFLRYMPYVMFPRGGGGVLDNPTENGDKPLDQGTYFCLCMTFDLGTVLTKKNTCLSF